MLELIASQQALEETAKRLAEASILAVDTEFVREKTYFPELCLIQIGAEDFACLIDCLAKLDFTPIYQPLTDPKKVKVFHSLRQDVEIIFQKCGRIPAPFFDTQVASQFLGYKHSPSYEILARDFLAVELDKSSQYSNWKKRPLSEKQIEYAEAEVTHLLRLYSVLKTRLQDTGRISWFEEEMQAMADEKIYQVNMDDLWHKVSYRGAGARNMAVIRELVLLREKLAIDRNLPRQWLFKDEEIVEIAKAMPRGLEELAAIEILQKQTKGKFADGVLGAVEVAISMAESELPKREYIPQTDNEKLSKLKQKLAEKSEQIGIQEPLIATVSELKKFLRNPESSLVSKGWRYEIFGREL